MEGESCVGAWNGYVLTDPQWDDHISVWRNSGDLGSRCDLVRYALIPPDPSVPNEAHDSLVYH